jgi:hypothetical protein
MVALIQPTLPGYQVRPRRIRWVRLGPENELNCLAFQESAAVQRLIVQAFGAATMHLSGSRDRQREAPVAA